MNDLISRSALIDSLYSCEGLKGRRTIEAVVTTINEQPTVEAIPVVRCKDCEHWGAWYVPDATNKVKVCENAGYMVGENGYCCYADMRGGQNGRT